MAKMTEERRLKYRELDKKAFDFKNKAISDFLEKTRVGEKARGVKVVALWGCSFEEITYRFILEIKR